MSYILPMSDQCRLPVKITPFEGETVFSWLRRMAIANGMKTTLEFVRYFVDPNAKKSPGNLCAGRIDCQIPLGGLWNMWNVDAAELFLNHTEYPAIAPFLSPYKQAYLLANAFGNPLGNNIMRSSANSKKEAQCVKYCPVCYKENAYAHVAHNLPGITACWKHRCKLDILPFTEKNSKLLYVPSDEQAADQEDIDIAEYAKRLLDNPLQCDYSVVNRLTYDRYKANIKQGALDQMISAVLDRGLGDLLFSECNKDSSSPMDIGEDYEILSQSVTFCVVRHECETVFAMNEWGLRHGMLCPKCQKSLSLKERVQGILRAEGEYELLSDLQTTNDTVSIRYPDGTVREHRASIFLNSLFPKPKAHLGYPGRYSDYGELTEERKKAVETMINSFQGFKCTDLVAPPYKGGFVASITHEACGRTFKRSLRSFKTSPVCPYCSAEAPSTDRENAICRQYLQEAKLDFEYLGGYHGSHSSITLRHSCGYEFKERFSIFKNDPVCPYCKRSETTGSGTFLASIREKYGSVFPRYQLAEDMGMSKQEVKSRIGSLSAAGLIRTIGDGKYEITPMDELNHVQCATRHSIPLYLKILNWAVTEHKDPIYVSAVAALFVIKSTTAASYLRKLEEYGLLIKTERGQFMLKNQNQKPLTEGEWSVLVYSDAVYAKVYRYIKNNMAITFTRKELEDSMDSTPETAMSLQDIQHALVILRHRGLLVKDSYTVYRVVNAEDNKDITGENNEESL